MNIPAEETAAHHARRGAIATVATLLALALVSFFAWRVYHFASLIQSGELTDEDLSFLDEFTASETVSSRPIPDGEFQTATADDPSIGSPDAKITIVEFADFGCPFSREESFVLRSVAARYGDSVRFVYRDFPIVELHPEAFNAAIAGECAADQGRFWEYHDKLYANQSDLSDEALLRYAMELNLNAGEFRRCLGNERNAKEVQADYDAGVAAGVRGTPTFFLNGIRVSGAIPEDVLTNLIERFQRQSV